MLAGVQMVQAPCTALHLPSIAPALPAPPLHRPCTSASIISCTFCTLHLKVATELEEGSRACPESHLSRQPSAVARLTGCRCQQLRLVSRHQRDIIGGGCTCRGAAASEQVERLDQPARGYTRAIYLLYFHDWGQSISTIGDNLFHDWGQSIPRLGTI